MTTRGRNLPINWSGLQTPERLLTSLIPNNSVSLRAPFSSRFTSVHNVASVANYYHGPVEGRPTEEAVVLELAAGDGRKDGWQEGWMAAEEVYSCLQAGLYLSRRSL